jgi:hypothetical protein
MNQILNSIAEIGKYKSTFSMVIGIILAIFFIIYGIFLIKESSLSNYHKINAIIKNAVCAPKLVTGTNVCNLLVTYKVNGLKYTSIVMNNSFSNRIGEYVKIYYNKTDPSNIIIEPLIPIYGYLSCLLGLIIGLIAYSYYYLTHNFQLYATIQGINTLMS